MPVLGIVLIAPVQPLIAQVFSNNPSAQFLVPMMITAPALAIAVVAPFAGAWADRWGRKKLLIGAMLIYGVFGTAPLWLNSLEAIIVSRVGLGITEGFVITLSTTLIADYFRDATRQKYLGYQIVVTTLAGTIFLAVGGALGEVGWRVPFWLYAASPLLAIPMFFVLWEPKHEPASRRVRLPWKTLATPLAVSVFAMILFYALIVYLPFLLAEKGVQNPGQIGLIAAVSSLATATGAFSFRFIAPKGFRVLLITAFGIIALGLVVTWWAGGVPFLVVGALVTSLGARILQPSMLAWAVSKLEPAKLGTGVGAWQCAIFIGQFITPILIGSLVVLTGGLQPSVGLLGIASAIALIAVLLLMRGARTATARELVEE